RRHVIVRSHYMVPTILANTKYSVNRQFTLSPAGCPQRARTKTVPASATRGRTLETQTNLEKTAGLKTLRPRPQQGRLSHKKRLAMPRQGVVSRCLPTPTCCASECG